MKSKRAQGLVLGCALLLTWACGKSIEQKQLEDAGKKMEEAGKKMEEAMKQGGEGFGEAMKKMGEAITTGKKVEPVDFRALKGLLPESLPGMKRTEAKGEKTAAFGINVSKAEGSYRADSGANIDITLTDMGSMTGLTAIAAYGWAMADIDRETDTGYEKTTTYSGNKIDLGKLDGMKMQGVQQ